MEWYANCTRTTSTHNKRFLEEEPNRDKTFFAFFNSLSLGGALAVFGGGIVIATIVLVLIFLREKK